MPINQCLLARRNLVTHLTGNTKYDEYLIAHETGHYLQQIKLGMGEMYRRILAEGPFNTSNYDMPGALEFGANLHSPYKVGYFYTEKYGYVYPSTLFSNYSNIPWWKMPSVY